MADADYDTDAYEGKLDAWYKEKSAYDAKVATRQREREAVKGAWDAKLAGYNTAKAELKARTRQLNATYRAYARCVNLINKLETRIEKHLAKSK